MKKILSAFLFLLGTYPLWTQAQQDTCASIANLTVSDITGSSVRIHWEEASVGNLSGHTVTYFGPDSIQTVIPGVQGSQCVLGGLSPNTLYTAYVTTQCEDGASSLPSSISFTTACQSGGDLLVGEDDYLATYSFPARKYALSEEIYTASELGGARTLQSISLHSASAGSNRNIALYLMPVELSGLEHFIPINSTAVKVFDGVVTMTAGWVTIYFDDNYYYDGTSNLMVVIDDNTGTSGSNSFFFTENPMGNLIRIHNNWNLNYNPSSAGTYSGTIHHYRHQIIFGDVCNNLADCVSPYTYLTDINDTFAMLNIVPGIGESEWTVDYRRADDSVWTTENSVYTTLYPLNNLIPNTNYIVRVKPYCGNGVPDHWATRSFRTSCGDLQLPYLEDFETSLISDNGSDFVSCWQRHSTGGGQTVTVGTALSEAHSGEHFLNLPATPTSGSIAVLPEINSVPLSTLEVEFYLSHPSNGVLEIGVMTDPDMAASFLPLDTIHPYFTNSYEKIVYPFPHYSGDGRYIAFRRTNGATGNLKIDDLTVRLSTGCYQPLTVNVVDVGPFSAEIAWTDPASTPQWNIEYGVSGFTQGTGTIVAANTNPFTLTGLLADHTYDFYLRSECDSGSHSDWTNGYTFETPCFEIDHFPYSENFSSPGTGNGIHNLPECWNRLSSEYVAIYNGTLGFTYYSGIAVLPRIADYDINGNPIDIRQLKLDLDASYYDGDDRVIIGVMTDPNDASTFQTVKVINVGYNFSSNFRHSEVYFYGYADTGRYIAVKNKYASYAVVDNFVISERDFSCSPPDSLRASHIGSDVAQICWSAGEIGDALEYTLQYKEHGDSIWTTASNNLNATQFWLTGLTASTTYDIRVRTRCTDNALGAWSDAMFTTSCSSTLQLPFFENFDSSDVLPDCWTQEYLCDTLSWTAAFPHPYPWGAHSTLYAARLYAGKWGTEMRTRLISPMLNLHSIPQAILRFWLANAPNNSDPADTLTIQYRTSPTADWITLATYNQYHSSWTQDSLLIPGGSDSCQIAFLGAIGQGYGVHIDDISVSEWDVAPTFCLPATNLTASDIGNHHIGLHWDPDISADYWVVFHREAGTAGWDSVTTTSPAVTITPLQGLTSYEIFVKTYCASILPALSDTILVSTTNIGVPEYESSITLQPNPTMGQLTIASPQSPIQRIEICDLVGRTLLCMTENGNTVRVNISELPNGVYFAKITTVRGETVRKVIKQ